MLKLFLSCLIAATFSIAMAAFAQSGGPQGQALVPGQMWSINSPSPTTIKVVIGRLESWNDKTAVHVALFDVPVPAGAPGAGNLIRVGHMPFEQSALVASLNELISKDVSPGPNFETGYAQWQSARGGIYSIGVSEAVAILFETLTKARTAPK